MTTWKTFFSVCRSKKTGRFSTKGRCRAFKRSKLRRAPRTKAGQFKLF